MEKQEMRNGNEKWETEIHGKAQTASTTPYKKNDKCEAGML